VEGIRRRLYSNEVTGRGPEPRRPGGAMVLTADRGGRALEAKLQINLSLILLTPNTRLIRTPELTNW
jgi:hypothetical protein